MNKINIYINSKNRKSNETTSNFKINIPNNLLTLNKDEFFTINVNGFYCFNSWYSIIDGVNNEFEIITTDIGDNITSRNTYKLNYGDPNVLEVQDNLNFLLNNMNIIAKQII